MVISKKNRWFGTDDEGGTSIKEVFKITVNLDETENLCKTTKLLFVIVNNLLNASI
jgi:hypothetical protein